MKTISTFILALALVTPVIAQKTSQKSQTLTQTNHSSKGAQESSTSVTTTSDGKTTVKKTVTVVDGVKKVVIETTDENGKTTRTENGNAAETKELAPWIGLRVSEVPRILRDQLGLPEEEGLAVELVAPESPAMKAGILKGDLLLRIGEQPVSSKEALSQSLQKNQVGEEVAAVLMRKAKRLEVKVKLAKAPDGTERVVPEELREGVEKSSVESVDVEVTGKGFDALLNDPDLPESFKKTIREMQKSLQEFEKKTK